MNLRLATWTFLAGAAAAAAVWALVWPADDPVELELPLAIQRVERLSVPSSADIAGWLRNLEDAPDAAAKAKAAERIGSLPASAFPAALDDVPLVKDWRVTLPAKVLLSRWAALDGEAAVKWAWLESRSSGRWSHVLREIVPSWAWHRPQNLAEWARQQIEPARRHPLTMSLAEIEAVDLPVLEPSDFRLIGHALAKVQPRLGFEILLVSGSMDFQSSKLADSLHSVAEIKEALSAFDCLGAMEPWRMAGTDQFVANALLRRWKQIGPEDFAGSAHAHLIPDHFPEPDLPELLPVVLAHQEWHGEFERWQQATPHTRPDMSGWTPAKREAWEDFEALRPER
jgi:hypothetical protein